MRIAPACHALCVEFSNSLGLDVTTDWSAQRPARFLTVVLNRERSQHF